MPSLSYSAHTNPDRVGAAAELQIRGNSLVVVTGEVDAFTCDLHAEGGGLTGVFSMAAQPLATAIIDLLAQHTSQIVKTIGPFPVTSISPFTQTVAGESLTVAPTNLNMTLIGGALAVISDVQIS